MLIRKLDPKLFHHAYGIDIQLLYPWEGTAATPFGAAWAVVPPGGSTKHHNHQEGETFFIARGRGVMQVGEERVAVEPGDVVFQQPFHSHTLTNTSADDDLLFLTVWWEDKKLWQAAAAAGRPERVLVTAAPPTPNGDLHLGHLSGPYLAADLHARYLRLRGVEARYACGSDDNSIFVKAKAEQLGVPPGEACSGFVASIEESFRLAAMSMDAFVHPNESPHHRALVQEFLRRLHAGGQLEEREEPCPHCETCDLYLFEAWVAGRCPHCGSGVVGHTCEDCGRVHDARHLLEPRCTRCGTPAATRPRRRLVFPLSRWSAALAEFHRGVAMGAHLRAFLDGLLADGLPDVAVTHPSDWGIPVPLPGYEDQRIYVWLEMAPRYFAYSRHVNERAGIDGDWDRFWRSPEAQVVQCFGFDNSFFYGALLPALFKAFDPEIRLPAAFLTNEFYRLEGAKFSTSRRHAIWAREFLGRVPADLVRFHLAWTAPETEGTNFTLAEFEDTVRRELVGSWQAWLSELGAKVRSEAGGKVPATGDWTPETRRFYHALERLMAAIAEAYEAATFSPQRAARLLSELVREARRFGKGEDHWRQVRERGEERRTGLALELLAAKLLAIAAHPILPGFAARLWHELGFDGPLGQGNWEEEPVWVPEGQELRGLGSSYFTAPGRVPAESTAPAMAPAESTAPALVGR